MLKELRALGYKEIDGIEYLLIGEVETGADDKKYYLACNKKAHFPASLYLVEDINTSEDDNSNNIETSEND